MKYHRLGHIQGHFSPKELSLYPIYHYIQYITISNISLYPIHHYIQYITISNISLYHCIQQVNNNESTIKFVDLSEIFTPRRDR